MVWTDDLRARRRGALNAKGEGMSKRAQTATALCVALLIAAIPKVFAQEIEWANDWHAALKIAQETHRPLMVHYNMDHEPACEEVARTHFHDKDVVRLSKKFVCVVCSLGEHSAENIVKDP